MNTRFYFKLAASNLKKNSRTFYPYLLACVGTVMMFYIMLFITTSRSLNNIGGAADIKVILTLGAIVIGLFSLLLLFYTNSFLIKRRKKELGLYNILGMEKRHIAKVLAVENLYAAVISLTLGIAFGVLLSKLMILLLGRLLNFDFSFRFEISFKAVWITTALFCAIFTLTLLKNLNQIRLSKPVELLSGGNVGEKEPKTKWLLTLIGLITLGGGYTIANVVDTPLEALGLFFVAVILVIIGTYCLFVAGSIALLKLMRKNKAFYYKTKHFTSVSGMIYRMNQNAAGLASICILSTMVLVMLSTTVSLYIGIDDEMRNQYPRNFEIFASGVSESDFERLCAAVDDAVVQYGFDVRGANAYCYASLAISREGGRFYAGGEGKAEVILLTAAQYEKMQGVEPSLSSNEALVFAPRGYDADKADFGGVVYGVKRIDGLNVRERTFLLEREVYCFVLPDRQAVEEVFTALTGGMPYGSDGYYGFDLAAGREEQAALYEHVNAAVKAFAPAEGAEHFHAYARSEAAVYGEFLAIYGGLFFLGIFLGTLFLMATVLIMYYKQVSEGYDDKQRFEIMQKVGMSRAEVRESIRSQILKVFFLPLAAALVHISAAFRMTVKLLRVFNLTNMWLFAGCSAATLVVFALFYAVAYALTARSYYKIVS